MALEFPNNPQPGDTYSGSNGVLYTYDGVKWLGSGVESGLALPIASTTVAGVVKIDGTSITIDNGVISSQTTTDITSITADISELQSNAVSQQIALNNLITLGNVAPVTDNETLWFNSDEGRLYIKTGNLWIDSNPAVLPPPSYVYNQLQDVVGDIIPDATNTYSLGSEISQWKDLWVSNATIYLDTVPLSVDITGNLTFNGNPLVSYVNGNLNVGGTVISGGTSTKLNAGQPDLGPPNNNGTTDIITLFDFNNPGVQTNYAIGVENDNIWFNTDLSNGQTGVKFLAKT